MGQALRPGSGSSGSLLHRQRKPNLHRITGDYRSDYPEPRSPAAKVRQQRF